MGKDIYYLRIVYDLMASYEEPSIVLPFTIVRIEMNQSQNMLFMIPNILFYEAPSVEVDILPSDVACLADPEGATVLSILSDTQFFIEMRNAVFKYRHNRACLVYECIRHGNSSEGEL